MIKERYWEKIEYLHGLREEKLFLIYEFQSLIILDFDN